MYREVYCSTDGMKGTEFYRSKNIWDRLERTMRVHHTEGADDSMHKFKPYR